MNPRIGILGGTLDPIHCGHLAAAVAARDAFDLARVLVIPSRVPPHRPLQPMASPFHRFAMASLAVSGVDRLEASDDELLLEGPSFTSDTLDRQHARGIAASQIFFITGVDAFADIATWRRYPEVVDLANFVVVSRPGYDIGALGAKLPELAGRIQAAADFRGGDRNPLIYLLQAPTPDVSSTAVRERLARGGTVGGLVPPLVAAHIQQHRLYSVSARANQLHDEN